MHTGRTIFSQILDFLPQYEFQKCVERYRGNHKVQKFSCYEQYLCLAFAQLTYRESLRDIEICLRSLQPRLYHAGFRAKISRSTLADANENRDWHIYADFAQALIKQARQLYANEDFGVTLRQTAYVLDSTIIDLCLSLFPWTPFRRGRAGVKLHTLMDLRGNIPCFICITGALVNDIPILDNLILEPGAFYIMDRGYVDFTRLHTFTQSSAFFIIRARDNLDYYRRAHRETDKTTGLRADQTILLAGNKSSKHYPDPLRRISFFDQDMKRKLVFLTNNFLLPPLTVAQLYKCRWRVELFFKWIKQYLRIKAFYGNSENAVKTQIWIAISVYLLVAIIKKQLGIDRSMGEILQILSITLFEKLPIYEALTRFDVQNEISDHSNQLNLFNL
jgi:hypothetical protein